MQLTQVVSPIALDSGAIPAEPANSAGGTAPSFQAAMGDELTVPAPGTDAPPDSRGQGWQPTMKMTMLASSPLALPATLAGATEQDEPLAVDAVAVKVDADADTGAISGVEKTSFAKCLSDVLDPASSAASLRDLQGGMGGASDVPPQHDTARNIHEENSTDTATAAADPAQGGVFGPQTTIPVAQQGVAVIAFGVDGRVAPDRAAQEVPLEVPLVAGTASERPEPTQPHAEPQSRAPGLARPEVGRPQPVAHDTAAPPVSEAPRADTRTPSIVPEISRVDSGQTRAGQGAAPEIVPHGRPRDAGPRPVATAEHGPNPDSQARIPAATPPQSERAAPDDAGESPTPLRTTQTAAPHPPPENAVAVLAETTKAERATVLDTSVSLDPDVVSLPQEQSPGEARLAPGAGRAQTPMPAFNAADARSVAVQIANVLTRTNERAIELRLHPEELGRVSLTLSGDGASMAVAVAVDRSDTLDLMRRHIDTLGDELRRLGYGSVTFSFADGQSGAGHGRNAGSVAIAAAADTEAASASDAQVTPQPRTNGPSPGGIDMRL